MTGLNFVISILILDHQFDGTGEFVKRMFFGRIFRGKRVVGVDLICRSFSEEVEKRKPNLVIVCSARIFQGKSGLAWIREIKERFSEIKVILLSGSEDPEMEDWALKSGADAFLKKPFYPERLEEEITRVLEIR